MTISPILLLISLLSGLLLPLPMSLAANLTSQYGALNASSLSSAMIQCSGLRYGFVKSDSCFSAWSKMPRSSDAHYYGPRREQQTDDVPLPIRYLSDDGHCAIDVNQKLKIVGAVGDVTTELTISDSAQSILQACVANSQFGGIIRDSVSLYQCY